MSYIGDYSLADTLYYNFTTINSAGVPASLAGSPALRAMKDDGTAQSSAGITLTADLGGTIGLNNVKIDTSADGTFYASGHDFAIEFTAGTINSNTLVGYTVARFSIQNRSALRPTTKTRTLDVTSTGEAGIDWANIGSPTTVVDLSGTNIKNVDNAVPGVSGNVTGSVASVTGNVGGNVTGSVGSVLAAVSITAASIQAIWDSVTSALTTIGSIGKLLVTNIDATISSRAPSSTAVSNIDYTAARAVKLDNLDVAVSTRLATAGYTAPDNADIVLIKAKTDNLPADPASNTQVNTRAPASTAVSNVDYTSARAVKLDDLDATISSRASQTSVNSIPTNPLLTTDSRLNNLDATISSRLPTSSYVAPNNAGIASIKAKTDNLPSDPASSTNVAAVPGDVWEELLVNHDTSGTFGANAQNPPLDPSQIADAVWDALIADHDTSGTFGETVQNGTGGGGSGGTDIVAYVEDSSELSATLESAEQIIGNVEETEEI